MAPVKSAEECYVQGTDMKLSEAIARQNGTYKPTGMEKATAAAKKLPGATQTTVTNFVAFVARKAKAVLPRLSEPVDEPAVVLPEDKYDEYYRLEDEEGVETGEEHDYEVVKAPTKPKKG